MKTTDRRHRPVSAPTTAATGALGARPSKPAARPSSDPGLRPDTQFSKTDATGALATAMALAKDEAGRDLVAIRTKGPAGLQAGEVLSGRLERAVHNGTQVATLRAEDGRDIRLKPSDVAGVQEGGRLTIRVDQRGRLAIDTKSTDPVRSFMGTVTRSKGRFELSSPGGKGAFTALPLVDADASMLGKTVLAHVENGLEPNRRAFVSEVIPEHMAWKKTFTGLALKAGVEATMSPEVMRDIARIREVFDPEKIEGYTDLSDKNWFSIDNPYSKDFDQAMAIEPTPGKADSFDVYYGIADLDYFLQLAGEDSALNQRAERVQTTTYLPGYDHPVLPRDISEDLCSLNEGQKRPSFVVKFSVDGKGEVSPPTFIDGVVLNRKNGNYGEAQAHIEGKPVADADYGRGIDMLKTVGERLLAKAESRGMMTASSGEKWASLDEKTGALKMESRGSLWIEAANAQISITSNQLIGQYLIGNDAPAFHRVHSDPEPRRVQRARTMVRKLGVQWGAHEKAKDVLQRVDLSTAKGKAVRRFLLRAMPRAQVEAMPGSHHGLKLAEYVQSTAPMRRTRDALNHRWVRDVRDGRVPDDSKLHALVENSQVAEGRSRSVDREVRGRLSAHALSEHEGKKLAAEVIGVSMFGVDLNFPDIGVEHFVPFRDLGGGPYDVVDGGLAVRGAGQRLTIGDSIQAQILETKPHDGQVRLQVSGAKPVRATDRAEAPAHSQSLAQVRGDGFESPLVGQKVKTEGVVCAVNGVGFYVQPVGAEGAAAGGVLVRSKKSDFRPGDLVSIEAKVHERRSADRPEERSIVELVKAKVKVTGHDPAALPKPAKVGGEGGAMVPADRKQAIDFWRERLGQRVEVGASTAVSAQNPFGDVVVIPDDWKPERATRTAQGGLIMPDGEWNHQSVGLKWRPHIGPKAELVVGAKIPKAEGVVTYRSGSFQLELTEAPTVSNPPPRPSPSTTLVGGPGNLTVAGVNALNMHPGELDRAKLLGARIANEMKAPDIIALQEIQDDDGPVKSEIVSADQTYQMLIDAVKEAGGPEYAWFDIAPENGKDGGQPGGNIRCGYLYRPDRVEVDTSSIRRIGEGDPAFEGSRKSLAAVFKAEGRELMVVNNHFASRHGSSPWTTAKDEMEVGRADQRADQAKAVRGYIDQQIERSPELSALVVGDFNDGYTSPTTQNLAAGAFSDLTLKIPEDQRFDYNYRGTLGVLQPVIGSPGLADRAELEILHEAVFEGVKSSDHDPVIIRVGLHADDKRPS